MLKKTITYIDYNGNERVEDFYFNLTKAEAIEMEAGVDGGLSAFIEKVIAEKDHKVLVKMFKDLVLQAYGIKSLDGKRFEKSDDIARAFSQTEAYSQLFMELATNANAATEFVNGIAPKIEAPAEQHPAIK